MNSEEIKLYEDELYKEENDESDKEQEREMEEYLYSKVHYASKVDIVGKKQDESNAEATIDKENTEFPDIECASNWEGILGLKESSKEHKTNIGAVVGEDSERWNIEADLEDGNRNTTSRYYIGDKLPNIYCYNCGQQGHVGKECPEEKKTPICYLCGIEGHPRRGCPNELCFNCMMAGHFAKDCPEQRKKPRHLMKCYRCKRVGHTKEECSERWRQYHCTITSGDIIKPTRKERKKANNIRFCYNCASKGHFGEDCSAARYSVRAVYSQFIVNYEACTSSPKPSNKIETSRQDEQDKKTEDEVQKDEAKMKGIDKNDAESKKKKDIGLEKTKEEDVGKENEEKKLDNAEAKRKEKVESKKLEAEKKKELKQKKSEEKEAETRDKEAEVKKKIENKKLKEEVTKKKEKDVEDKTKKKETEKEEAKKKGRHEKETDSEKKRDEKAVKKSEKRERKLDEKRDKEKKKRDEEEVKKKEKEKKEARKKEKEEKERERKREELERKEKRKREKDEAVEAKRKTKEEEKIRKKEEKEKTRKRRHDQIETTPPASPSGTKQKRTPRIELIRNNMWVSDQDLTLPKEEVGFSMKDHLNISNSENEEEDDRRRERSRKKKKKSSREKADEYIVVDSFDTGNVESEDDSTLSNHSPDVDTAKEKDKLEKRPSKKRKKPSSDNEKLVDDSANVNTNLSNISNIDKGNYELERPNKKKKIEGSEEKHRDEGKGSDIVVDAEDLTKNQSTEKPEFEIGDTEKSDEDSKTETEKSNLDESICIVADSPGGDDQLQMFDKTGDNSTNPIEILDEADSDGISIGAPEISDKEIEEPQLPQPVEKIIVEDLTQEEEDSDLLNTEERDENKEDRPRTPEQIREHSKDEKDSPRRLAARLDYEALQNLKEILYNDDDDDVIDDTTPIPDPQVHFEEDDDDVSNYEIDKVGDRGMDESASLDGNCSTDSDEESDEGSGDEIEDDDEEDDVIEVPEDNDRVGNMKDLTRYDPRRVYQEHLVAYNLINTPQKHPRHIPAVQSAPSLQTTYVRPDANNSFRRGADPPRRIVIDPTVKVEKKYPDWSLKGLLSQRQRHLIAKRKATFMIKELGITNLPKREKKLLKKQYESEINQFHNQVIEETLEKFNLTSADVANNTTKIKLKQKVKSINKKKRKEEAKLEKLIAEKDGTFRVTRASVKKSVAKEQKRQNKLQNKVSQPETTQNNQRGFQSNLQNNRKQTQNISQNSKRQSQNNSPNNWRQSQNNSPNNWRQSQNYSQDNWRQSPNNVQRGFRKTPQNNQQPSWMRHYPFNTQQWDLDQQYTDFGD